MLPSLLRAAAALAASSSLLCAQWLQKAPSTQPTPRSGAAMTFDPITQSLLLFGGGAPLISSETWIYNGTDWVLLAPPNAPTARFGAQLVYDAFRGVAVLYGGLASNISIPPPNSDTWEWNGTTWSQASPTANVGPRYQYGACFDLVRGRTVLYGGSASQLLAPPSNQTWEYQGTTWTQVTTVGSPGPRNRPAMCFHTGIGKTVLFGGSDGSSLTDSTWLYDGSTWTQVPIVGNKPLARSSAAMAYDPTRNLSVLMGGQDMNGPLSDTWTFDGTTWTPQLVTTQAVRDHVMAFLPASNQVVKFGGFSAAPNTLSNQTWELAAGIYGRGCVGTNGVPTLSASAAPQLGMPLTFNVGNLNPTFNLAFVALGLTPLPGIDLTNVLGMTGCSAFSAADLLVSVTGSGGSASLVWPAVTGPIGAALFAQALCLDPTANSFGFTVSNAIFATINN
ncbi:MAG: kelch repeat-containing protein [Planctomycetota bacterium]